VKKSGGRASWRAIAPASSCPRRLGGSLALPTSAGFELLYGSRDWEKLSEHLEHIASPTRWNFRGGRCESAPTLDSTVGTPLKSPFRPSENSPRTRGQPQVSAHKRPASLSHTNIPVVVGTSLRSLPPKRDRPIFIAVAFPSKPWYEEFAFGNESWF